MMLNIHIEEKSYWSAERERERERESVCVSFFLFCFFQFVNWENCLCRLVVALPFAFEAILRLSAAFVTLFDVLTKAVGPIVSIHCTLLHIHFLFLFGVLLSSLLSLRRRRLRCLIN